MLRFRGESQARACHCNFISDEGDLAPVFSIRAARFWWGRALSFQPCGSLVSGTHTPSGTDARVSGKRCQDILEERYPPQPNEACMLLDQQGRLRAALDLVQVLIWCLWGRNSARGCIAEEIQRSSAGSSKSCHALVPRRQSDTPVCWPWVRNNLCEKQREPCPPAWSSWEGLKLE